METGLEGKPWYYGLGLGLALTLGLFAAYHFKLSEGMRDQIAAQDTKIQQLQQGISKGQAAKLRLPQLRDQFQILDLELEKLLRILPVRRNTQELIRRIRILSEQAGFNLRVFDPAEREIDRDFYKEWPIKMELDGGYHELALFFDRISRLSRIINIDNLRISARRSQTQHTITARFTAKTFVYKEPDPNEAKPKPSKKKRGKK
ncbi:MAG: type 4a pilus biogenesis protein PilO [Acidobacteria bacterium]|nr:type 4a pilus biogenesis protein PilO [Acidobacteriota bacterium]